MPFGPFSIRPDPKTSISESSVPNRRLLFFLISSFFCVGFARLSPARWFVGFSPVMDRDFPDLDFFFSVSKATYEKFGLHLRSDPPPFLRFRSDFFPSSHQADPPTSPDSAHFFVVTRPFYLLTYETQSFDGRRHGGLFLLPRGLVGVLRHGFFFSCLRGWASNSQPSFIDPRRSLSPCPFSSCGNLAFLCPRILTLPKTFQVGLTFPLRSLFTAVQG